MLPAWVIFPVVLPTKTLFSSAFWISELSISSKFTSTEISLPSFLMGTGFLPNGRTMKTFVMMHLQPSARRRVTPRERCRFAFPGRPITRKCIRSRGPPRELISKQAARSAHHVFRMLLRD
jgi:hypothetical protein